LTNHAILTKWSVICIHYCNWVMKDLELCGKMIYGSRVVLLALVSDLDVLTS
jgi:hypothetical protein